ncbi:rhodanese-like domain-containing protein, partial [Enterococcus faecalis]
TCQSGLRSKNAPKILARKNYHVINVRGAMSQWSGQIKGGK